MTELKDETISVDLTYEQLKMVYILYFSLREELKKDDPIYISELENTFKPIREAWYEACCGHWDEDDYI